MQYRRRLRAERAAEEERRLQEAIANRRRAAQLAHAQQLGDRFGYEYKRFALRVNRGALQRYKHVRGQTAPVVSPEDNIPVTVSFTISYLHDIAAAASAAPTLLPQYLLRSLRTWFHYFWCPLQVVFKVKVPRTEARAAQQSYVPVNDDVIVDGFVDEGLTSEVARMQAYNLHAMYGSE